MVEVLSLSLRQQQWHFEAIALACLAYVFISGFCVAFLDAGKTDE